MKRPPRMILLALAFVLTLGVVAWATNQVETPKTEELAAIIVNPSPQTKSVPSSQPSKVRKAATFSGKGTKSDPYLISSAADLVSLADSVNGNDDLSYGSGSNVYSKTFSGEYFALQNDIDMSGVEFTPIGNGFSYRFCGVFDGQGHTIKNLTVSTGSSGYAGLFGYADTTSVIKNLTIENASISATSNYAGGVAAMSYGEIEGCHVTGTITNTAIGCAGITASGMNISNCSFAGSINGTGGITGGIVGQVFGTVSSCYAKGSVIVSAKSAGYSGGGVAAILYGQDAKCKDCYFSGTVDGSKRTNLYVGGVVGQNYLGTIEECFAVADVIGNGAKATVGGVAGIIAGTLLNSYAIGDIQCAKSTMTGGIVGCVQSATVDEQVLQSSITNCYFSGNILAKITSYNTATGVRETLGEIYSGAEPVVTNVYFDCQMIDFGSETYRALSSELTSASGPSGFDSDKWVFTEGYYPRLKAIADNDAAKLGASVLAFDTTIPDNTSYVSKNTDIKVLGETTSSLMKGGELSQSGNCGSISNSQYVLNNQFGADTVVLYHPTDTLLAQRRIEIATCPYAFEGSGTESDPFQIKTKADVMLLGNITTNYCQHFTGVYFKQMNDIDMEKDTAFIGIGASLANQTEYGFGGTYDGGNFTLHNVKMDIVGWKTAPTETDLGTPNDKDTRCSSYKGFIGILDAKGMLKNLTMADDCEFNLWSIAGAFVGSNYGTIDNCRNFGEVRCYSTTAGGIAGLNPKTGTISNCLNAGNVYGGWRLYGGIVGNTSGTVVNCMNVGSVEVKMLSTYKSKATMFMVAGGIAGQALGAYFKNIVNAGHVEAAGGETGGLFGTFNASTASSDNYVGNNDAINCINYGSVFTNAPATTGAIAGKGYPTTAEIKNVYYDKQITGLQTIANASASNMEGLTSEQLLAGTALSGFDTNEWQFTKGQYPVLKQFADVEVVQAASKVTLGFQNEETVKSLTQDVTLSSAQWSLTVGTQFSISGTTLKVPTVSDDLAYDTLVVVNNQFASKYALAAVPDVPLAGSGTEEDPFQIVDPRTWDAFATYMAKTANSFPEKYVKIMNDIDFSDTTFVPFGYDGTTGFDGHLLGGNHIVSGISYTTTATYQGAICILGASGTVQDLTLGGKITTAKAYTGGFFGKMSGYAKNCVNNIEISSTGTASGGFAGYATGEAKFEGCVNNAAITGSKGNVAGFVGSARAGITFIDCTNNGAVTNSGTIKNTGGFVASGYSSTYENCVNNGTITSETGAIVGGLQGLADGSDTIYFKNCSNSGAITGASSVGGLLGAVSTESSNAPIVAENCFNIGNIKSLLTTTYGTGGLFGILAKGSVIDNCYNTGEIASEKSDYIGGIWGFYKTATSASETTSVKNCYNKGNINTERSFVGGIGNIPAYTTVENCYNLGTMNASAAAGGIGNVVGKEVSIKNCWNAGDITTSANAAGGILGYENFSTTVENSFNAGNVTAGTKNAGGLGGQTRTVFVNCYNRGTITSPSGCGGLAGCAIQADGQLYGTAFYHCYNAGIVTPADSLCGNIIGNTVSWSTANGNVIEDTYYVTDYYGAEYATDSIGGTAVTVKQLAAMTDMQGDWTFGDDYVYPIIKGMEDNECAKAFAVAVVLDEGDTYSDVKGSFTLGELDNVEWSTSSDNVTTKPVTLIGYPIDEMHSEVTLTATCGEFAAPWVLYVNSTDVKEALTSASVVSQTYYNLQGVQVAEPESGQIYIVVRNYSDGTRKASKEVK